MHAHRWYVIALLVMAGCQSKLNDDRVLNLDVGEIKEIKIDAPRYDQKLTVALSSDADVTIAVYLDKDKAEVESKLEKSQKPTTALAFQENVKSATIEATIPAKQEAIVRVMSLRKAATAKLSIKGR